MGRPISKTTKFILALPRTLSAKEVLEKAKASGLKTSENNVHRVRRVHRGPKAANKTRAVAAGAPNALGARVIRSRSTPGRKRSAVAKPARTVVAATQANGSRAGVEDLLRAVAAELGLGRALEILQSQRAQVRAVFGG